jgi:hypothetical protein
MNALRVRLFSPTGQRLPDINLTSISTTEAATRALRKIAKSEESGLRGEHLAQIDAGRLEWSALRRMFTKPEIRKAIESRLADVNIPRSEREQLLDLLETPSYWSAALGGDDAVDRFGVRRGSAPRGSHQDSFGASASRGDETPEFRMAKEMAKGYGWRVTRSLPGGGLAMHHQRRGGDELSIDTMGEWEHQRRGGAVVAKGGPHLLNAHLLNVHGLND